MYISIRAAVVPIFTSNRDENNRASSSLCFTHPGLDITWSLCLKSAACVLRMCVSHFGQAEMEEMWRDSSGGTV